MTGATGKPNATSAESNQVSRVQVPDSAPRLNASQRILELDGLRGVASAQVLIYHCFYGAIIAHRPDPLAYLRYATGLTWTAVDLFFVLSGFLIGGILLEGRESPAYYGTFYFRRVCRILPAYFAFLLIMVICYRFFYPFSLPIENTAFQDPMPWYSYFTFTQNIWMTARNSLGAYVLAITWALSVEEQFYLVLPWAIRNVSLRRLPYYLFAGILIAPALRSILLYRTPSLNTAAYALLPCRMDSLLIGVLIALLLRRDTVWEFLVVRRRWLWGVFAVLAAGMLYFNHFSVAADAVPNATIGFDWSALFYGTVIVIALTQSNGILARFLRSWWLRFLGAIAAGTYLIHVFVYVLLMSALRHHGYVRWSAGDLAGSLASIILTLGIAKLSWELFEKKFVRWGRRLTY